MMPLVTPLTLQVFIAFFPGVMVNFVLTWLGYGVWLFVQTTV